jgi:hypothetical protein
LFKFLVWPASNERGKPDIARKITDKAGPRTFETFKGDWETFLPNAEKPANWNEYPSAAAPCKNHPTLQRGDLVLASFTKFGNVDEVGSKPGLANLLIAQNSSYVRYLAAYNEIVFCNIRDNELYNSSFVGGHVKPAPVGTAIPPLTNEDDGALTIKSAWIELPAKGPNQIDASRFYVRPGAWVQNPDKQTCHQSDVGLVGLHIVYKRQSLGRNGSGRRSNTSTTFLRQILNPVRDSTFNDGSGHPMTTDPEPGYKISRPTGSSGPGDSPRPYQVERLQNVRTDVTFANNAQQSALRNLGSVWQYYGLVMTQWPRVPGDPLEVQSSIPEPPSSMRIGPAVTTQPWRRFFRRSRSPFSGSPAWAATRMRERPISFFRSRAIRKAQPAKRACPLRALRRSSRSKTSCRKRGRRSS